MPTASIRAFRSVLEDAGLVPEEIIADGKVHRCGITGKEHGQDGAYSLSLDDHAWGWCKNHCTGHVGKWAANNTPSQSTAQPVRYAEDIDRKSHQRQREQSQSHAKARERAKRVIAASLPAPATHPYLAKKAIKPVGNVRLTRDGALLVPILDSLGFVMSAQRIFGSGLKRFLSGGQVQGGFFPIEGEEGTLFIVEGYATGATIHEATGGTVLVAFHCGNLLPVATMARALYPERPIVLCADNDHETANRDGKNPGLDHAANAARSSGALLAVPVFKEPAGKTDFNDLAAAEGLDAVRSCLDAAKLPPPSPDATAQVESRASLVALPLTDFLHFQFPKRDYIIDPIMTEQGSALLFAPPGRGKTFLALTIAYAVATGQPVLRWNTPKPRQVLFVDGEMQGWMLQERFTSIIKGYNSVMPNPDFLRIVTPDTQADFMPNLATPEGQAALEPLLAGVELLIIDNLATLCRVGKENETESWLPVQTWVLSLRRRGISVVLVHHANKSGTQRGTSAREDIMETIISLRPPKGHRTEDGACFEVHHEKIRGIPGGVVEPFEAALINDGERLTWSTTDLGDDNLEIIASLHASGLSIRAIEQQTGLSRSKVHRLLEKIPKAPASLPRKSAGRRVPASQS